VPSLHEIRLHVWSASRRSSSSWRDEPVRGHLPFLWCGITRNRKITTLRSRANHWLVHHSCDSALALHVPTRCVADSRAGAFNPCNVLLRGMAFCGPFQALVSFPVLAAKEPIRRVLDISLCSARDHGIATLPRDQAQPLIVSGNA
jgi:hypothetical protein